MKQKLAALFQRFAIGKPEFTLLVAGAVLCLSVFCFFAVADEMSEGEFHDAEERLLINLREKDDPGRPIGPAG